MNKKNIISIVVGVAMLFVIIISATYAYFSVDVTNTNGTTVINQSAGTVGNISLTNPTESLHFSLKAADMREGKKNTKYYATDIASKSYDIDSEKIARKVALATVVGGDTDTKYECTFDLNVNLSGSMASVLSEGDAKIIFSGALEEESDLSTVASTRVVRMVHLSGVNTEESVKVMVVFNNKDANQNHLKNKELEINLSNSNFSCEIRKDAGELLIAAKPKNLSEELLGGLYRYQGTSEEVDNNYICFGTDSKSACLADQDTYMFRIIGITPDGQLKLIKKTSIVNMENNLFNIQSSWSDSSDTEWPNTNIMRMLNNVYNSISSDWQSLIARTTWKYGDLTTSDFETVMASNDVYDVEGAWTDTVSANLGLMYLHDMTYANPDINFAEMYQTQMSGNIYAPLRETWLYMTNNQTFSETTAEWFMARNSSPYAWTADSNGIVNALSYSSVNIIRPVLYLVNDIALNGSGTINNPYTIIMASGVENLPSIVNYYNYGFAFEATKVNNIENLPYILYEYEGDDQEYSMRSHYDTEQECENAKTNNNDICINDSFFIKETLDYVKANSDLYELHISYFGAPVQTGQLALDECQRLAPKYSSLNGSCVKTVDSGDYYYKSSSEACANFRVNNVDNIMCIKPNDWENVESYKSTFEEIPGVTCTYSETSQLTCKNQLSSCTLTSSGIASCRSNLTSSSPYDCIASSDGVTFGCSD